MQYSEPTITIVNDQPQLLEDKIVVGYDPEGWFVERRRVEETVERRTTVVTSSDRAATAEEAVRQAIADFDLPVYIRGDDRARAAAEEGGS